MHYPPRQHWVANFDHMLKHRLILQEVLQRPRHTDNMTSPLTTLVILGVFFLFNVANCKKLYSSSWRPYLQTLGKDKIESTTAKILAYGPRFPGSSGHADTKAYLVSRMSSLSHCQYEEDTFDDNTPIGTKTFSNLILTCGSSSRQRIILAAHWDSKIFDFPFVGATDSAVSVAILLELSSFMDMMFRLHPDGPSVQFVLFDGEEAFVQWKNNDHTYGSRHLASKWESEGKLSSIKTLVLLDLLGAKQSPRVYGYMKAVDREYGMLAKLEETLRQKAILQNGRQLLAGQHLNVGLSDDRMFLVLPYLPMFILMISFLLSCVRMPRCPLC
jgi:hypothetical protein